MTAEMLPWEKAAHDEQRRALIAALEKTAGNISHAATELKLSRSQTTRLVKLHELAAAAAKLRTGSGASSKAAGGRGRPRSRNRQTSI